MITSSEKVELNSLEGKPGQSLRSFVKDILTKMEPMDVVLFMDCDVAVVRNYVSTFRSSFLLRSYQSRMTPDGLKVRRLK